jgi:hypothetical protein
MGVAGHVDQRARAGRGVRAHDPADVQLTRVGRQRRLGHVEGEHRRVRAAVRWHVASYWDFFRRHRTVMVAPQQAAAVDEGFARRLQAMAEPDLEHIADHLAGLPLTSDPLTTARMVTALLQSFIATWEGGDEVVDTLTDFIYAAIGGPGSAALSLSG